MQQNETTAGSEHLSKQLVVFGIGPRRLGVTIDSVLEMTPLGEVDAIPGVPAWVTGMMKLRDSVLPVVDLRVRLGMPSLDEEGAAVSAIVRKSKDEHVEWLRSLERACREGASFDPGASCHFNHWRTEFHPEDPRLRHLLEKLEGPHQALHDIAKRALAISAAGDTVRSGDRVREAASQELADVVALFDELEKQVERTRKMVLVLRTEERAACVAVDRVESVLSYEAHQEEPVPLAELVEGCGLVREVIKPLEDARLIQVLDVDELFRNTPQHPAG